MKKLSLTVCILSRVDFSDFFLVLLNLLFHKCFTIFLTSCNLFGSSFDYLKQILL